MFHEKSPFFNERHYSNKVTFFQSQCINLVINDRPVNLRKEMLQADELFPQIMILNDATHFLSI